MKTLKLKLSKEIKNAYLVQGEDFYLFEKAKSMILNACKIQMPDLNISSFDEDNFTAKAFLDSCEAFPIGDEYRIIILKGITKISETDKKEILAYLKNPVKSTVIIILDYVSKFDFLKKNVEFIDARRMENSLLVKIIVNDLSKLGKTISLEAVNALIESCNGYLTKIQNEIIKLAYFSDDLLITKQLVDKIVIKDMEYTTFELTEALASRNGDKALRILSLMDSEIGVFSLISNHFRRLFFISISEMTNLDLAEYLGVKEYAVLKARNQLKGFSKIQLRKINKLLEEIDFNVKSGKMNSKNALYFLVFNILYI